jgi:hypothetical protein
MVQQAENNASRYKDDLERAREESNKLAKKHKKSKASILPGSLSATLFMGLIYLI